MRLLILGFTVFWLAGCSNSETEVEIVTAEVTESTAPLVEKTLVHEPTVKTGAAVVFASDFAGSLSVGEMVPLVIHLTPEYASGQLEIDIKGQDGLIVVGQTRFSESFSGDYQFTHELMVGAEQAGEYYLGVVANVITSSGEEARAFSETILVVDPTAALTDKVNEAAENVEDLESYLPAIEEIITH